VEPIDTEGSHYAWFTKKVNEVGAIPDGIETDVEMAEPEDGKSGNEDGSDEQSNGSENDDGDEDDVSENIDTVIENINKACEANTHDEYENVNGWTTATTGRQTRAPERYSQEVSASEVDSLICEQNYYKLRNDDEDEDEDEDKDEDEDEDEDDDDDNGHKLACVGAGSGGGFSNTRELQVMKYKQAMKTKDKDKRDDAVFEEHERMVNISV
jgi:hypothetical protein